MRVTPGAVTSLDTHPGLPAILDVLSRLTEINDVQMAELAERWHNDERLSAWRHAALSPDSPLILDVLQTFDSLDALYAEDLSADPPAWVGLPRETTRRGMNAVRDAIAAVFASPVLSGAGTAALSGPWTGVMGAGSGTAPDLGVHADKINDLVTAARELSGRCHDANARAVFDALAVAVYADAAERDDARGMVYSTARAADRHRRWALIRRTVRQQLSRPCSVCRRSDGSEDRDVQRVAELVADGACALLVTDLSAPRFIAMLVSPVEMLIPVQRETSG